MIKLLDKADIVPVVGDHIRSMDRSDVVFFFLPPIGLAVAVVAECFRVTNLDGVLTALSLLVGLLFNLLVIMFDRADGLPREQAIQSADPRTKLVKETQANTSYALLVGLVAVGILAVGSLAGKDQLPVWISAILAFLVSHFLLTLLMIIKRIRSTFLSIFT